MGPARRSTILAAAFLVVILAGCGVSTDGDSGARSTEAPSRSDGPGDAGPASVPAGWWKVLDEEFEAVEDKESSVPTIDLDGRCELGDAIEVDGQESGQFGTGASAFGESGRRYVCEFSDPVSVDVIVGRFTEPEEYDDFKASLAADGYAEVDVDGTAFQVKKVEAQNGAHTDFTVVHLVDDRDGFVTLDLELTHDDQRARFTDEQAAEVPAGFLRG